MSKKKKDKKKSKKEKKLKLKKWLKKPGVSELLTLKPSPNISDDVHRNMVTGMTDELYDED